MKKFLIVAFIAISSIASYALGRNYKPDLWLEASLPAHLTHGRCREATAHEVRVFERAVEILETFERGDGYSLVLGATQFLAHGLTRDVGGNGFPVCPPAGIYERTFNALNTNDGLLFGRPVETEMALMHKLQHHPQRLVQQVAMVAFNTQPEGGEMGFIPPHDIRPLALSALAASGPEALPWRDQAMNQTNADSALGTGAAQVAVAAGHPEALRRVADLMEVILKAVPEDAAIPEGPMTRLEELAYAISLGGDDARRHVGLIKRAMQHKVRGASMHYGILEVDPVAFCYVLWRIEGKQSPAAGEFKYCRDSAYRN